MQIEAEQEKTSDLDSWSGKMYQEPSALTKEKISELSSKKQSKSSTKKLPLFLSLRTDGQQADALPTWVENGALRGEFLTHSFGESPKDAVESHLSQILEDYPHQKYYLSEKACKGILRRAERRGKDLPPMLRQALLEMIAYWQNIEQGGLTPYTLKIRSGCSGGGKGALVQTDKSATLSTLQDQTLFQPLDVDCRNGALNEVATPLQERMSNSLNAGGVVACMATQQGGAEIRTDDMAPTLTAAAGMSGNNQPVICIQGNCIDRADTAGCNGKGWTEDVSYTLNTIDRPAVAVGIPLINDQGGSVIQASDNADVSPTLRAEMHGNIPAVVQSAGFKSNQGAKAHGIAYEHEKAPTLASGQTDASVVIAIENHPNDSRIKLSEDNVVQTLSGRMGTGGGNTPMILECYSQDAYDKYTKNGMSATLKNTGGVYGGGEVKL